MPTREIPRTAWARTLEDLSTCHACEAVDVRVESDMGDQPLAHDLPLLGISCELKGSEAQAIEITLGRPVGEAHYTHVIARPTHLWLKEDDRGTVTVLDIEDEAKVKTLVFFRA